jgi:hypothetical protein
MHVVVQQIREEPQASDPLSHAAPFSGHKQHRECLCTFPCLERMQQHDECERLLFCCLLVRSLLVPMQLSEPFSSSSATSTSHSNAPELHEHVYGQIRLRQRRFSGVVSYSTKSTLVYVPRTLAHTPSQKFVRTGAGTRIQISPSTRKLSGIPLVSVILTYIAVLSCKGWRWVVRKPEQCCCRISGSCQQISQIE